MATFFAHHCHFFLISLGCHPLERITPHLFYLPTSFLHYFFVNLPTKIFLPSGVTFLEGVTLGGPPPPPSDATGRRIQKRKCWICIGWSFLVLVIRAGKDWGNVGQPSSCNASQLPLFSLILISYGRLTRLLASCRWHVKSFHIMLYL